MAFAKYKTRENSNVIILFSLCTVLVDELRFISHEINVIYLDLSIIDEI